ncbi:MAG: hypothetical protein ACJAS4_002121 [Bacteriovoracaceae bacterium]|jgi:hypothetical protein
MENGEIVLNRIFIIILLLFMVTSAFSQEPEVLPMTPEVIVITENELLAKIKALKEVSYSEFIGELEQINELTTTFINSRNDECLGSFSEVSINDKGERVVKKKKLDRKERNHCLYMLVNFRIKIVEGIYQTRQVYLKTLQEQQVEELKKSEKLKVGALQKLASKYKK